MAEPRVSFTMTQKVSKKSLIKRIDSEDNTQDIPRNVDFIHSLEDQEIKSTVPKPKKSEYIVPLIKNNVWRLPTAKDSSEGAKVDDEHHKLQEQAASAILKDLQECKEKGESEEDLRVPLLLKNKPPVIQGREDDELADVDLRPESSTLQEYKELPIGKFGEAMLRGMGWKKGEAIGKTNKGLVEPIELMPRAQGRGLGAEEKLTKMGGAKRKPGDEPPKPRSVFKDKDGRMRFYKGLDEEIPEQRPEGFVEGNFACVLSGAHHGLYGKILNVNEVSNRVTLELGINEQVLSFSKDNLQLVSPEEFARNKKRPASGESSVRRDHSVQLPAKRKHHKSDSKSRPSQETPLSRAGSGEQKMRTASKPCVSSEPSEVPWLFPNLRVRIIDQKFHNGIYYNQKVLIIDVITPEFCVCKTDDGQLLESVHCSMLETVIPRQVNSLVRVVIGKHKGKIATLIEKSRSEQRALLDLGSGNVKHFHYDNICECVTLNE